MKTGVIYLLVQPEEFCNRLRGTEDHGIQFVSLDYSCEVEQRRAQSRHDAAQSS